MPSVTPAKQTHHLSHHTSAVSRPLSPRIEAWICEQRDRGAIFYISDSGGKDSQAMKINLLRLVPAGQVVIIHADLAGIEWEDTQKWVNQYSHGYRVEVVHAANNRDWWDRVEHRKKFPGPATRWCTSDLKRDPIHKLIRNDLKARGLSLGINCVGIRAEESKSRANMKPITFNKRLSKAGREVYELFPIHDFTWREVFDTIAAAGQEPHWAYKVGMERLSCCFCIMASGRDLRISAKHNPKLYQRFVQAEERLGFTLIQGKTLKEIVEGGLDFEGKETGCGSLLETKEYLRESFGDKQSKQLELFAV